MPENGRSRRLAARDGRGGSWKSWTKGDRGRVRQRKMAEENYWLRKVDHKLLGKEKWAFLNARKKGSPRKVKKGKSRRKRWVDSSGNSGCAAKRGKLLTKPVGGLKRKDRKNGNMPLHVGKGALADVGDWNR